MMTPEQYGRDVEVALSAAARPGFQFYDCETWLGRPGLQTPKVVCTAYEGPGMAGPVLLNRDDSVRLWSVLHSNAEAHHVNMSLFYDVLCLIVESGEQGLYDMMAAAEQGRCTCLWLRARFKDLAEDGNIEGTYSLATLTKRYLNVSRDSVKKGPDAWRKRYAELDGVPIWEWPEAAVTYPLDDVRDAKELFFKLGGPQHYPSEVLKTCRDLMFRLSCADGFRTDPDYAAQLRADFDEKITELEKPLYQYGILKPDGKRSMAVIRDYVTKAYEHLAAPEMEVDVPGGKSFTMPGPPTTSTGAVKTDKKTLQFASRYSPELSTLVERNRLEGHKTKYIDKMLDMGWYHPVTGRYSSLQATGRSSASQPPIQQMPRADGLREGIVPREGYVFLSADYDALEMRTWAHVCEEVVGHSVLAERFREDPAFDPHTYGAALTLGISYKEAMRRKKAGDAELKEMRQCFKAANFGYPGGMGWRSFIPYAEGYGLKLTNAKAKWLKEMWERTWPEAPLYMAWVKSQVPFHGATATIEQLVTGRIRAGCSFTELGNTLFQGLAADGADVAGWRLACEMYGYKPGPLTGARQKAFIHDEWLLEVPNPSGRLDGPEILAAARSMERHMIQGMEACVNIPIRCEAVALPRWCKG